MIIQVTHHRHTEDGAVPPAKFGPTTMTLIIVGVVAVAVVGRFVTHRLDRARIGDYAARNGWTLEQCSWRLFGPGWFGNRRERIYELRYRDREGRLHAAFAKTSALAGVYLSEDRIVEGG